MGDQEAKERSPPIFKMVNLSLIHDADDLRSWSPFIRAVNCYIVNGKNAPKKDVVCYRGSKMTDEQASGLTAGRVLRPCMFFAMSTNKEVAKMYTGETGYMLEVHVPRGCMNACPISHLACIEDEEEVLLPPYSPILVKRRRQEFLDGRNYKIIEVEVLDGQVVNAFEEGQCDPSTIDMDRVMSAFRTPSRACVC